MSYWNSLVSEDGTPGGGTVADASGNSGWSMADMSAQPAASTAPALPMAPTSFKYTPGGAIDPAMVKYLQDFYQQASGQGSGYGWAGLGNLNFKDPNSPTGI